MNKPKARTPGNTGGHYRDSSTGQFQSEKRHRPEATRVERVQFKDKAGQATTVYRDAKTGSFTTQKSDRSIRNTSSRAAETLKRLAKR